MGDGLHRLPKRTGYQLAQPIVCKRTDVNRKDFQVWFLINCDFTLESQKEGLPSVWMYGGGRQSACIAALIIQKALPQPDYAVIADTGREKQSTWDYLKSVVQPALPFPIHVVPKSELATVDLWGGKDGNSLLIPAFTNESGEVGKMPNFCSNEWKTRVCARWLRKRGVSVFQSWIGFSVNEVARWTKMKKAQGDYVRLPLVDDLPMTTAEAVRTVEGMGWPIPVHSACWMCPNMTDDEWLSLTPEEFEKACVLDEEIRLRDPNAFLHKSCVPLRQVSFKKNAEQPRPCDSGVCFV
jgi:hypothetical protein